MPLKNTLAFVVAAGVLCAASYADTIHVPGDYQTIQAGIDAAQDGDEIVVAAGTWTGEGNKNLDILGKTLTLRSADGPETCIIDAEGSGRGICVRRQSEVVIEGFTMRNGRAEGGGICCRHSDLRIVRCVIKDNAAPPGKPGGGLLAVSSTILIEGSEFRSNRAGDGLWGRGLDPDGGNGGGLYVLRGSLTLVECTVRGNEAGEGAAYDQHGGDGGDGGGIYANGSTVLIVDSQIRANLTGRGGLVGADWGGSGSGGAGGGLFVDGALSLIRSTVAYNRARWGGSGGSGGGVRVAGEALLAHARIIGNSAGDAVGSCVTGGGSGGGVLATGDSIAIVCCLIADNHAGDSVCYPDSCIDGEWHCEAFSWGGSGGGVSASESALITNCTIISNSAGSGYTRQSDGGGVNGGVIRNSIVRDNSPNAVHATSSVTYSNIEGGHAGIGNIDREPMFVDPENGDYRLAPGSPCIDAADNSAVPGDVTTDLDGYARFVDDPDTEDTGDGDPPIVDMGAYEFQGRSCPADLDDSGVVDFGDVLVVLRAWGNPGGREDLDGSGVVDFGDVLLVLAAWGPCDA